MTGTALLIAACAALAYAALSRRLSSSVLTGPMVFLCLGWALSDTAMLEAESAEAALHILAEVTLIIVLFADATRVDPAKLLTQHRWPLRMLGLGLPLTIALGTVIGWLLLPGWTIWEVALLAAILAPTDAALGEAVVTNPRVPERVRRTLTVESGLNDGLALPMVLLLGCVAVGGVHDFQQTSWLIFAIEQIGFGVLAGAAVGFAGGKLLSLARARNLSQPALEGIAILALAGLAYLLSSELGGNGFLAAFVGGLGFRLSQNAPTPYLEEFMETEGALLVLATFLLVGLVLVPDALGALSPATVALLVASLLLVRPLGIWLSLAGTDSTPPARAFMGWFGPRGLATVLFALLIVSDFHALSHAHEILQISVLAVLLSTLLHGVTAAPAANRFGGRLS